MNPSEPCLIQLRPLVEGCDELGMVAYVKQTVIRIEHLPQIGVKYKDWTLPTRIRSYEDLGDYEYTGPEAGPNGYLGFAFAKSKTDEEKAIPFREYTKSDDFTWPAVLLGIAVYPDEGFPQSTYAVVNGSKTLISAPRYYGRELYIPQTRLSTLHTIQEFVSPTKFKIGATTQPIPQPVDYEVLNVERSFPACLHDDLTLPATRTGTAQLVAGKVGGGRAGAVDGYHFPATNHKTWTAHYIHDDQQFTNGAWHRVRIRVSPPPLPKPVRN
jgi:hypothetical protein